MNRSGQTFSSHCPNPSPMSSDNGRALNMASVATMTTERGPRPIASISRTLVIAVISPADTASNAEKHWSVDASDPARSTVLGSSLWISWARRVRFYQWRLRPLMTDRTDVSSAAIACRPKAKSSCRAAIYDQEYRPRRYSCSSSLSARSQDVESTNRTPQPLHRELPDIFRLEVRSERGRNPVVYKDLAIRRLAT